MELDKWFYIKQISLLSDKYDDKLIDMLDFYDKYALREITYEEAKEYYEKLNKK